MVSGPKKLIFHFCFYSNFLLLLIFCQMSPQSTLCCLTKNGTKKSETNGLRDTPQEGGEMLLQWQHLIYTHFWGWIHFLSNVSTPILFSKRSKNLTRTPFFHPTLTQYPGSPVAPIHFLHIFKMDGLDVGNSPTWTESRYLRPLRVFRALEKNQIFDKKTRH